MTEHGGPRPDPNLLDRPYFDLRDHFWASLGKDLFVFLFTLRDDPRTPAPLVDAIQAKILAIAYPNGVPERFREADDAVVE